MRGRFTHRAMLAILLICQIAVCLGKETADPNNSKYLDAVREFVPITFLNTAAIPTIPNIRLYL